MSGTAKQYPKAVAAKQVTAGNTGATALAGGPREPQGLTREQRLPWNVHRLITWWIGLHSGMVHFHKLREMNIPVTSERVWQCISANGRDTRQHATQGSAPEGTR
jgi:hypothetical protein